MTDEEMAVEAQRAILKYAHNEKVIRCLSDKFVEIAQSLRGTSKNSSFSGVVDLESG